MAPIDHWSTPCILNSCALGVFQWSIGAICFANRLPLFDPGAVSPERTSRRFSVCLCVPASILRTIPIRPLLARDTGSCRDPSCPLRRPSSLWWGPSTLATSTLATSTLATSTLTPSTLTTWGWRSIWSCLSVRPFDLGHRQIVVPLERICVGIETGNFDMSSYLPIPSMDCTMQGRRNCLAITVDSSRVEHGPNGISRVPNGGIGTYTMRTAENPLDSAARTANSSKRLFNVGLYVPRTLAQVWGL